MNAHEFVKLKVTTEKELREKMEFVKEFETAKHSECYNCGDKLNQKQLEAESWSGVKYCWACNTISIVYFSDRMGGNYTDTVKIFK